MKEVDVSQLDDIQSPNWVWVREICRVERYQYVTPLHSMEPR